MATFRHPSAPILDQLETLTNPWHRRECVFLALEWLLRIDVLLLESTFLQETEWQDPRLRDRLLILTRPSSLGDWAEWLAWAIQTAPINPWISNLKRWHKARRAAVSKLIHLRNKGAHAADRTDPFAVEANAQESTQLLHDIFTRHPEIGSFESCSDARVKYISDSTVVECDPILLHSDEADERLWMYDRSSPDGIHYVCASGDDAYISASALHQLLARVQIKTSSITAISERAPELLTLSRVRSVSQQTIDRLRSTGRYKSESSVARTDVNLIGNAFLTDTPALLLLEGPRGCGKSTWCCQFVEAHQSKGHSVIFLTGNELLNSPFPVGVGSACGIGGDVLQWGARLAGVSPNGVLIVVIDDVDVLASTGRLIDYFKAAESLGGVPIKFVLTISTHAFGQFRTVASDWLPSRRVRVALVPALGETEIDELASILPTPTGRHGEALRMARRETAAVLTKLMGSSVRPWLARLVLERVVPETASNIPSAFELYTEIYREEILAGSYGARPRVLRELALFLNASHQDSLSTDDDRVIASAALGALENNSMAVSSLIEEGLIIEARSPYSRQISFSDERFRDFVLSLTLNFKSSQDVTSRVSEGIVEGRPITPTIFALARLFSQEPSHCTTLFPEIPTVLGAVLKELAIYHMPALVWYLRSVPSASVQVALDIGEWLLYSESPNNAAAIAEILIDSAPHNLRWRAYLLHALCRFGVDDYHGAHKSLASIDISGHIRAFTLTGDIAVAKSQWHDAETAYQTALSLDCAEYPEGPGHALRGLGYVYLSVGRLDEAEARLAEAVKEFSDRGDSVNHAEALGDYGEVLCAKGRFLESMAALRSCLLMNQRLGRIGGAGIVEGLMAIVDLKQGEKESAERRLLKALQLVRHASYRWREAWLLERLAELEDSKGLIDSARSLRGRARAIRDVLSKGESLP